VAKIGQLTLSKNCHEGGQTIPLTFLVGVAASAVMVVLPYYLHDYKVFGKITILGEFTAVASICMCGLFLFVDIGQPMRALNVFLYPSPAVDRILGCTGIKRVSVSECRHRVECA